MTGMPTLALLLKICMPPVLVALMSLAARRWGPAIGGLILGLPWMTGPVAYFLGLENGPAYLVAVTGGIELAVWGIGAFILGLGYASRVWPWLPSLLVAIICYGAIALLTQSLELPLALTTLISALVLLATYRLLPLPNSSAMPRSLPPWDIPARMAVTFVLVGIIVLSADRLGPQRSGILASFPVILTVIGVFTLRHWGRDALLRVLRGVALSLLAFVGFFAVVGFGAPAWGQNIAFAAATLVAVAISGTLISMNARVAKRQSQAAFSPISGRPENPARLH